MSDLSNVKRPQNATAVIVLNDGTVFWGRGIGAETSAIGEICFNTSMTGYQEILTDPSYAGQIITFTFPHIGNVGTNKEDIETINPVARGLIVREDITAPSNWRARWIAKPFTTYCGALVSAPSVARASPANRLACCRTIDAGAKSKKRRCPTVMVCR